MGFFMDPSCPAEGPGLRPWPGAGWGLLSTAGSGGEAGLSLLPLTLLVLGATAGGDSFGSSRGPDAPPERKREGALTVPGGGRSAGCPRAPPLTRGGGSLPPRAEVSLGHARGPVLTACRVGKPGPSRAQPLRPRAPRGVCVLQLLEESAESAGVRWLLSASSAWPVAPFVALWREKQRFLARLFRCARGRPGFQLLQQPVRGRRGKQRTQGSHHCVPH